MKEEKESKAKRPKIFTIDAKPYSYSVKFCVASRKQGSEWLKRQGVSDYELTGDVAITCEPEASNNPVCVCIWMHPEEKMATLVHELVHAAVRILRGSGVPVTASSEEALAYLVEHLFIEAQWRMMRPVGSK